MADLGRIVLRVECRLAVEGFVFDRGNHESLSAVKFYAMRAISVVEEVSCLEADMIEMQSLMLAGCCLYLFSDWARRQEFANHLGSVSLHGAHIVDKVVLEVYASNATYS